MPTHYDADYWKIPLEARVERARERCRQWKQMLARSRSRLLAPAKTEHTIKGANEMVDIWGRRIRMPAIKIVFRNDMERRMRHRQYLDDFEKYIRAKMEYERLLKELKDREGQNGRPTSNTSTKSRRPAIRPPEAKKPASKPLSKNDELFLRLQKEAHEKLKKSYAKLKRERTEESVKEVLVDLADTQATGNSTPLPAVAEKEAGTVTREIEIKAEGKFRTVPTSGNYVKWKVKQGNSQCFGEDREINPLETVKRLRPPGPYEVRKGDTLSSIARDFYGDVSLWDVIYEANTAPMDPDLILPRTVLDIP